MVGEQEKGGEDRVSLARERSSLIGSVDRPASATLSSATSSLIKPKRKPAPCKPDSAGMNTASPIPENLSSPSPSPHPPSSSSSSSASTASTALLPSSTPLENLNTNRNNSTCLNQTLPPFSSSHTSPSPMPSLLFRDTPILRRAPRTSSFAKYQTLPVEDGGRSRARRRNSLSEGGSKTHLSHQGGGGPKLGRIMRNKRSQSMSGMLLPKEGDGDSDKGRCDSDWILESTV
ncbi:hypothetical protein LDENG_00153790 [Lucifuga dentata]|nr:hypothetical protein LDENG_00153790 [Lucifuga dentata]